MRPLLSLPRSIVSLIAHFHGGERMVRTDNHRGVVLRKSVRLRKGDHFKLLSNTVPPIGPPGLGWLEQMGDCQGTVLSINSIHRGKSHVWGSAALVAPGIALTAAHVVTELKDAGHLDGPDVALLFGGVRRGATTMWVARHVTVVGQTDLAIVSLDLRSRIPRDRTIRVLEMTTRLPGVGEAVMAAGFCAGQEAFDNGPKSSAVNGRMLRTVGQVIAVHQDGRDRVMAPYPCVEIAMAARGGMSGGPVFDREGRLFGLISTSLDDQPYAVVSLIWPALGVSFPTAWPKGLYASSTNLIDASGAGGGGFLRYPDRVSALSDGTPGTFWRDSPGVQF